MIFVYLLKARHMEEIWVPVVTWMSGKKYDFTGYYEASDLGRIRGVERYDSIGRLRKQTIKKPQFGKSDYYIVGLCKEGVNKSFAVAKIVFESFNGKVPEGMQVNHIDEDKTNNRLDNLNLMSPKENSNWGGRTERVAKAQQNRPDTSKTVLQYDLDGNLIHEWPSTKEIERCLGFHNPSISACCLKKKFYERQYAYGYIWKYKEKEAV